MQNLGISESLARRDHDIVPCSSITRFVYSRQYSLLTNFRMAYAFPRRRRFQCLLSYHFPSRICGPNGQFLAAAFQLENCDVQYAVDFQRNLVLIRKSILVKSDLNTVAT